MVTSMESPRLLEATATGFDGEALRPREGRDGGGHNGASWHGRGAPPRVPALAIRRTRLEQLLDDNADRRVVLVRGPVGAGKTVLVSQWVTARADPCVWLSIDTTHDDPRRLLSHLTEAVGRLTPWGAGEPAASPPDPGEVDDAVLRDVLGVASHDRGTKITLVVDNVHRLRAPEARRALGRLIERPPDATRLVLISRSKPRLGLERARMRGDLVEIPPIALRFDRPEIEALVASCPDGGDVAVLEQTTMGWAAGLRLAQLAAETDHAAHSLPAEPDAIAGDYVREELDGSAPGLRSFLEVSCWLPTLTEPLFAAVAGLTGTFSALTWSDREALPIVPVASRPGTYRYPPMLTRVMQRDLERHDRQAAAMARRRAARACRQAGELATALELFLQANRTDEAAEVCAELAGAGEQPLRIVDELLHRLPEATPTGRRWIPWRIRAAVAAGHVEEARQLIEHVDRTADTAISTPPDTGTCGAARHEHHDMVIARAVLAERRGDAAELLACADRLALLAGAEGLHPHAHRQADRWRLRALAWQGDLDGAGAALAELERRTDPTPDASLETSLARGWIAWAGGDIAGLASSLPASDHPESDDGGRGLELAMLAGAVHRERGQLAKALPLMQQARLLAAEACHRVVEALAASELARCHLAAGDVMGALELVVSTRAAHPRLPASVDVHLRASEVRARLDHGDVDGAHATLRDAPAGVDTELLGVRVALRRSPDQARALLQTIEPSTPRQSVDKLLLHAQMPELDEADARAALVEAISAGEPLGLVRTVLDEGPPVTRQLQTLALTSPDRAVGRLAALAAHELAMPPTRGSTEVIDPLTPRELTVLRMLPLRISNREMAAQMYISLNTLKTHVRAIYRKLDVPHRSAAVRRAKALQLV